MSRVSQILIGIICLLLAAALFASSQLDDAAKTPAGIGGLIAFGIFFAFLGVSCTFTWGRPVTTRITAGTIALSVLGWAGFVAVEGTFKTLAPLGSFGTIGALFSAPLWIAIAIAAGTYCVTGNYPYHFPLGDVFGGKESNESGCTGAGDD